MQNLINSLIEKFSNQHIFNLGQYDIFSRLDSFGDIPGHGIILFLDLRILWAISPSSFWSLEWVLLVVIGSYVDFPGQRCQWVQNKLLSVIFPDSLIPSVLGTSKVVTLSYNFPAGEHQFDTFIKNFFMQEEKTSKWLSDCFRPFRTSFQLEFLDLGLRLHGANDGFQFSSSLRSAVSFNKISMQCSGCQSML